MTNILIHIPHASLEVPDDFYGGLTITRELFRRYNLEMSDVGIDELFRDLPGERITAPFSRLYCDVERFSDDAREPMARYGEGAVYTHTYDGRSFHVHDVAYRDEVMKYYAAYHRRLDAAAERLLGQGDALLILDCHSFSDKMASHFFEPPFPDVCVGTVAGFCDDSIVAGLTAEIRRRGYSCEVNYPYAGSIVPNAVLSGRLKGTLTSVMLEINKRIYL